MGTGLEELRRAAAEMAEAADRTAQLGEEIRTVADRHRGDVAAAGKALLDVREVVQTTSQQLAEGAARGLAEIVAAIEQVEHAALRVRVAAQANRATTERLTQQVEQVASRATAHATSAEQISAAAEQQGASTEEMAAAAAHMLEAAEKLRGLVQGLRV